MAELGALDLQEEEPGLLARAMAFLRQNPGRMPTMEDRTPGIDRPAQRGIIDEVGTALMVPQSPLDFGMLALGGPIPKAAKLGAVALGAAMEPSEAEAGGAGKMAALLGGGANVIARVRDAGIPGIKYLDQGSRAAGDGSRNYVVNDDSLIEILRKYGLAGLPTAGVASGGGFGALAPDDRGL